MTGCYSNLRPSAGCPRYSSTDAHEVAAHEVESHVRLAPVNNVYAEATMTSMSSYDGAERRPTEFEKPLKTPADRVQIDVVKAR